MATALQALLALRAWGQKQDNTRDPAQRHTVSGVDQAALIAVTSARLGMHERTISMAAAFGLTPAALQKELTHSVEIGRICASCRDSEMCRSWLDGQIRDIAADAFCPNAMKFEVLAAKERAADWRQRNSQISS